MIECDECGKQLRDRRALASHDRVHDGREWISETADRFWSKVEVSPGCWVWTGSKDADGYGRFWLDGKHHGAHRVVWMLDTGLWPALTIDHLCRNRACVRPDHLEDVSFRENVLRGENPAAKAARQTHCVNGHPFDEANTWVSPKGGQRVCRACRREIQRNYKARKRVERLARKTA